MSQEMFLEAVRAAKDGQRRRARDLLTRLIKADPEKADYWLWLSATVDSEKEQLYCLQKAIKLDPNATPAKRGLVLLGALKPEEAALPPPPKLDDFIAAQPVSKAARAAGGFLADPRNRLMLFVGGAALVLAVVMGLLGLRVFAPNTWDQIFNPPKVVVVTPTAPPTATALPPSETPLPPEAATATARPQACEPPAVVSPATPLYVYLCLPESTPRPYVPTEVALPPQEAYKSVRNAYYQQNWAVVIDFKEQAIEAEADSPFPYFYVAEAYRSLGGAANLREAINHYRLALARNGVFAPAFYGRALARFAQGDSNEALRDLDGALKADPAFAPAYRARSEYYSANGNAARALQDAEQLRSLAAEDGDALSRLALAYLQNGRPQDALATAEQALALDQAQVLAYYARGQARLALSEVEGAAADLALSHRYVVDPVSFPQLFPIASALNFANAYAANALAAYGAAQAQLGEAEAALAALNEALTRFAGLPAARVTRGQLYLQAARFEEAREDFNAAIGALQSSTADPATLVSAYIGNGEALLATSRPEGALSNFLAATRLAPANVPAQIGLGRAYLAAGQPEAASAAFTTALAAAADDAETLAALVGRAQAYTAAGEAELARADWERVAGAGPANLAPTAAAALTALAPAAATPAASATPGVTATRTATVAAASATTTRTPTAQPGTPARTATP